MYAGWGGGCFGCKQAQEQNRSELASKGARVHDEASFRVKSYTDHHDEHFATEQEGQSSRVARGKSTKIQNNVVTAFLSPGSNGSTSAWESTTVLVELQPLMRKDADTLTEAMKQAVST